MHEIVNEIVNETCPEKVFVIKENCRIVSRYIQNQKEKDKGKIIQIIKFSTSDNAFRVLWLVRSILVISSYTLVWPYIVNDCAKRC